MKGFILFTLLSVVFVSDYAFAQDCPCDTVELEDGTTGNDIVELLCPDGQLGEGNEFVLLPDFVSISGEGVSYETEIFPDAQDFGRCEIFTLTDNRARKLVPEDALICRNSLIQRCRLNTTPIPTLSEWGLVATAGVLGVVGLYLVARRRKAAV